MWLVAYDMSVLGGGGVLHTAKQAGERGGGGGGRLQDATQPHANLTEERKFPP